MPEMENALRLRVNSCLSVIQDICERFSEEELHPRLVEQLRRLNELLSILDHQSITESDLTRIENSTNLLLTELKFLFSQQGLGTLYKDSVH